ITSVLVALQELAARLSPRQLERYALLPVLGSALLQVIFAAASILVTVSLFVVVYRFMPKAQVTLRDTLPGAVLGGRRLVKTKNIFACRLNNCECDQI